MPPIRRQGPRGSLISTRLPVFSLSGGVGRQAPNKRLPSEAENLDNVLLSLEKSFEKRGGFKLMKPAGYDGKTVYSFTDDTSRIDISRFNNIPSDHKVWFYWFVINSDNTFLLGVDYTASGISDNILYVLKVNPDNTWQDITPLPQWDPNDATIPNTYTSGNVHSEKVEAYRVYYNATYSANIDYGTAKSHGLVTASTRAYITFGSDNTANEPDSVLQITALGTQLIILNKLVKAGFSSDSDGKLYNLSGIKTTTNDIGGRPVTYYTASRLDQVRNNEGTLLGFKPTSTTNANSVANIEVSDYEYYDRNYRYLGQSLDSFADWKSPPEKSDWFAVNSRFPVGQSTSDDTTAREMLRVLYDSESPYYSIVHEGKKLPDGRGKIYYFKNSYLTVTEGYYRVLSFSESMGTQTVQSDWGTNATINNVVGYGNPYLQKIRTPDKCSVIDAARMPQVIVFKLNENPNRSWKIQALSWKHRTTGDIESNPGPSIFLDSNKTPVQVEINAMALYKDRLYFAAKDVIFSSRLGEYSDLWLGDPSTGVNDADPIDIRASSNVYSEVESLTPFQDFLFIITKSSSQYKLMGTSGSSDLTPLTAAVSPMTFYSTAKLVSPLLMSSQLYFFDKKRLYLLIGQQGANVSQAVETSFVCPGYLPENYGATAVAQAQDTIMFVDRDNKNTIYMYTNRWSGDRVIQSAFFRYVLDTTTEVLSMKVVDNYLYAVTKRPRKTYTSNPEYYYFLEKHLLRSEDPYIPRIDRLFEVKIIKNTNPVTGSWNGNATYNPLRAETTFRLPYMLNNTDIEKVVVVLTSSDWGDDQSLVLKPDSITNNTTYKYCDIVVSGELSAVFGENYTGVIEGFAKAGRYISIGEKFLMKAELSPLFIRDESNNIVDGVLNIRTGLFRHFDTGNYDIVVARNKRPAYRSSFTNQRLDESVFVDPLPLEIKTSSGEFVAKIFGYNDDITISIESDYPTPCNITNMEFKGKFKQKYSTFEN
jgi:hypothetical protein